jgi:hypothetical protein
MSSMISLYIDNELKLEEKKDFVEKVHHDKVFYEDTLDYLDQEMLLHGDVFAAIPDPGYKERFIRFRFSRSFFKPLTGAVAGALVTAMVVLMLLHRPAGPENHMNRFVIYRPDVSNVEITGSFTGWKRVPLKPLGGSGYWEVTLPVSKGVHRFTYILEGHTPFPDPTVLAVENDDFGGTNSILVTES